MAPGAKRIAEDGSGPSRPRGEKRSVDLEEVGAAPRLRADILGGDPGKMKLRSRLVCRAIKARKNTAGQMAGSETSQERIWAARGKL
eukprot:5932145-Amphidinium_carterae.1